MKFIFKLFSKTLWGSVFGFIGQYAKIIGAVLLFAFGVHYATLKSNHKNLKSEHKILKADKEKLENAKDSLNVVISTLQSKGLQDSTNFTSRVTEFQTLIQQLQKKSKDREVYVKELESGLLCKQIKIGLFGKKTVTIAPCEPDN
jgi:hypothetical protein